MISYQSLFNESSVDADNISTSDLTISSSVNLPFLTPLQAVTTDANSNLISMAYTNSNTPLTIMYRDASGNTIVNQLTCNYLVVNNNLVFIGLRITPSSNNISVFSVTNAANTLTYINFDSTNNIVTLSNATININGNCNFSNPITLGYYTTNGFLKTNSSNGTISIDTNVYLTTTTAASTYLTITNAASTYQTISGMGSYLTKNNPQYTGIMYTPMTASAIVQTNGGSQLFASTTLPTGITIPSPALIGTILTGLTYGCLVQTDNSQNLIASNTLPSSCSATNMTLTTPTLSGTVTVSALTASQLVQTNASKQLISSNTLPSGCAATNMTLTTPTLSGNTTCNNILPSATGTYSLGSASFVYSYIYSINHYSTFYYDATGTNYLNYVSSVGWESNVPLCPTLTGTQSLGISTMPWGNLYTNAATINGTITTNLTASQLVQTNASKQLITSNTLPGSCTASNMTLSGTITTGLSASGVVQTNASSQLTSSTSITISQINSSNASPYNIIWNGGAIYPQSSTSDLGLSTNLFRSLYLSSNLYCSTLTPNTGTNINVSSGNTMTLTSTVSSGYPSILYIKNTTTTAGTNANGCSLEFDWFNASTACSCTLTAGGGWLNFIGGGGCTSLVSNNLSIGNSSSNWPGIYTTFLSAAGNVYPNANNTYTSGTSSNRWSNVYSNAGNFSGTVNIGSNLIVNGSLGFGGQSGWDLNMQLQSPNAVYSQARCPGWNTYSNRALKENIVPIENALETVQQVQGVNFTWKEGQGDNMPGMTPKKQYGFIAEDICQVLPNMCSFDVNNEPNGVDYSKITPLLVEAIKELSAQVTALQAQVNALKIN